MGVDDRYDPLFRHTNAATPGGLTGVVHHTAGLQHVHRSSTRSPQHADAEGTSHVGRNVVVLTALGVEYQAVRAHLSQIRTHRHPAGTIFEAGRLPGTSRRIVIGITGEGQSAAAILAERAIAMFDPDALLFVGIAAALRENINLGDVIVATRVYAYHGGKDTDEGFLARPRSWESPHELDQLARHIARAGTWTTVLPEHATPAVHFKPVAAGDVVLNSRTTSLAHQIRAFYNDAVAIEMESVGAAHAGHLNQSLPIMIIRGISDWADGRKHIADDAGWQPAAAANAAAFAIRLITAILSHHDSTAQGLRTVVEQARQNRSQRLRKPAPVKPSEPVSGQHCLKSREPGEPAEPSEDDRAGVGLGAGKVFG